MLNMLSQKTGAGGVSPSEARTPEQKTGNYQLPLSKLAERGLEEGGPLFAAFLKLLRIRPDELNVLVDKI